MIAVVHLVRENVQRIVQLVELKEVFEEFAKDEQLLVLADFESESVFPMETVAGHAVREVVVLVLDCLLSAP